MKSRQRRNYIQKRASRWAVALMMVFSLVVGSVVIAAEPNLHANAAATTPTAGQSTVVGGQAATQREAAQTRLADAKLKICQNREKAINNIMARFANRGSQQLNTFSEIAQRTETFYATKGKTLSNYDALVADVNAKKTVAQTAVDAVRSNSVSFKCDGTDPKGAAANFKNSLKSEITALKAYKTAVKNLIVGVKSVQGTATSTDNKTTTGGQQ